MECSLVKADNTNGILLMPLHRKGKIVKAREGNVPSGDDTNGRPDNGRAHEGTSGAPSLAVLESQASSIHEAAVSYASQGLWVLALHSTDPDGNCTCADEACTTVGKHMRNTCATRSEDVIREWWRKWPQANVGLSTGRENHLVVLDVDPNDGGDRSLAALAQRHRPLPLTGEVRSGSGGRHLYFRHPGGTVLSRNGWRRGIDIRGDGGYVVAPPSVHRTRKRYAWIRTGRLAAVPSWLLDLLA